MMNTTFHWALEIDGMNKKKTLYDFCSCSQCQNWPEVTMCCYNNVKIGLKLQCAVTTMSKLA